MVVMIPMTFVVGRFIVGVLVLVLLPVGLGNVQALDAGAERGHQVFVDDGEELALVVVQVDVGFIKVAVDTRALVRRKIVEALVLVVHLDVEGVGELAQLEL